MTLTPLTGDSILVKRMNSYRFDITHGRIEGSPVAANFRSAGHSKVDLSKSIKWEADKKTSQCDYGFCIATCSVCSGTRYLLSCNNNQDQQNQFSPTQPKNVYKPILNTLLRLLINLLTRTHVVQSNNQGWCIVHFYRSLHYNYQIALKSGTANTTHVRPCSYCQMHGTATGGIEL